MDERMAKDNKSKDIQRIQIETIAEKRNMKHISNQEKLKTLKAVKDLNAIKIL